MDLSSVGIRYSIYINDRLCKYCDTFRQKYKKICAKKFFHLFWVSNGSIRLNLSYNDKSYIVAHINDLEELFPENELLREEDCFTFSYVLFFSQFEFNVNLHVNLCYNLVTIFFFLDLNLIMLLNFFFSSFFFIATEYVLYNLPHLKSL